MTIVLNGTTGITNDGGYTGDGVVFADTTPANTLVTTTGGNVGIGTSSPNYKLTLNGGAGATAIQLCNTASGTTSGDGFLLYQDGSDCRLQNTEAGNMLFYTGNTERARIDSSGNLLVGATAADSGSRLLVRGASSTSADYALVVERANGSDILSCRNDGNVLMPGVYNNTTGTAVNMVVGSDGFLYRSTSSLKYKKNVQDATHGLAEVLQLRSVTYEGNADADAGKNFGGLIAEEVHEAGLTEFVQYAEDGSPDALAYGNMVSLAFKAIQEQQAIITALTARVAALEGTQP